MLRSEFDPIAAKNEKSFARRTLKTGAAYAFAVVLWVLVWWGAAKKIGIELILPTPLAVIKAMGKLCAEKGFFGNVFFSMLRILSGFGLGAVIGTLFAILSYLILPVKIFLAPILKVVRATPVASFILIAILWLPSNVVPAFIALLMVVPIVYGNVYKALDGTDRRLIEMARVYGLDMPKRIVYLYVPTLLPYLGAALTTSLGLAWKSGIAAEVLCVTKDSIGEGLYLSKIYFETAELFAWTVTVVIMSVILEYAAVGVTAIIKRRKSNGRNKSREDI